MMGVLQATQEVMQKKYGGFRQDLCTRRRKIRYKQMNRRAVEIKNGGVYAAYQELQLTIDQVASETSISVAVTFMGDTITKRLLLTPDGNFLLLLADILDAIKKTEYAFKPFDDFTLDAFKPLVIVHGVTTVTVDIINAIDSPDAYINSGDFLTRSRSILLDERFEQGLNFFGEIEVTLITEIGEVVLTEGTADQMNYLSLRGLAEFKEEGATKVNAWGFSSTTGRAYNLPGVQYNELDHSFEQGHGDAKHKPRRESDRLRGGHAVRC